MNNKIKSKIYELIETIDDKNILAQVMKDVNFYVDQLDITDELSSGQLKELDLAIAEANDKQTIDWNKFKRELDEWKSR